MSYSIEKTELTERPVLVANRRVTRDQISTAIGEILPKVFQHAQANGIAPTSPPLTRYLAMDGEEMTVQPGVCVSSGPPDGSATDLDEGEVHWDALPGGPAVKTIHQGSYDTLGDAYRAMEAWIAAEGLTPAGAPWEVYLTDPTQVADPADWKTEVFWPAK